MELGYVNASSKLKTAVWDYSRVFSAYNIFIAPSAASNFLFVLCYGPSLLILRT